MGTYLSCNDKENITNEIENNKKIIIDKFIKNIKGKEILIKNNSHCGSEG
jgi:hypothetical protein